MFGYNDMNTYVPNPFAVNDMIRMSGSGRKPQRNKNSVGYAGIGSIIVIDPVRDLGLSDFLSSGSLGQFSFQATVTYEIILGHTYGAATTAAPDQFEAMEIATI